MLNSFIISGEVVNTLVFLWSGKDKLARRSTYAAYDSGGINMFVYENMVKALRLSWLKK